MIQDRFDTKRCRFVALPVVNSHKGHVASCTESFFLRKKGVSLIPLILVLILALTTKMVSWFDVGREIDHPQSSSKTDSNVTDLLGAVSRLSSH